MRGDTLKYGYLLCKIDENQKLEIKKIDVTDKQGRDYFLSMLSSDLDGIKSAVIAFSCLIASFAVLFAALLASYKKKDQAG